MDKLQEVLSLIPPQPDSIILCDSSVCLLHECCLLLKCLSLLNNNKLTKLICKPTRITDKTSTILLYYTILYYIIVGKEEHITQSGSIPIGFSDNYIFVVVGKLINSNNGINKIVNILSMNNYSK